MVKRATIHKNLAEIEEHNPDACKIAVKLYGRSYKTEFLFKKYDDARDWIRSVDLSDVETVGITVAKRDQKIEHMVVKMDTIMAEQGWEEKVSGTAAAPTEESRMFPKQISGTGMVDTVHPTEERFLPKVEMTWGEQPK